MSGFAGRTLIIQSFRRDNVPRWMQRCLDSVRGWAAARGHDYAFHGDEFYDLCGAEYLARAGGNPRTITNLARLLATREALRQGYGRVAWLDADVLIFAPDSFTLDLAAPYAFAREVWVSRNDAGRPFSMEPTIHNAAFYFATNHSDLSVLIDLTRYTVMTRKITNSHQVGVRLVRGLQPILGFPDFTHVGMFSPLMIRGLAEGDEAMTRLFGAAHGFAVHAANLCWSMSDGQDAATVERAMDQLEATGGDIVNRHAPNAGIRLLVRPR